MGRRLWTAVRWVMGLGVVAVLMAVGVVVGRAWWLAREQAELTHEEVVRVERLRAGSVTSAVVATPHAPATARCFEGLVDDGQRPVAGVAVSVAAADAAEGDVPLDARFDAAQVGAAVGAPLAGTITDAEGVFRVCEVPDGVVRLWAEAADGRSASVELRWSARPVRLTLFSGGPIAGVVVDDDERPIAGAQVLVESPGAGRAVVTQADADGVFTVAVPVGPVRASARAAGFLLARGEVELQPAARGLRVKLERLVRARVTVLRGGDRAPGVRVEAHGAPHVNGVSDANGELTLEGLTRRTDSLWADTRGAMGVVPWSPPPGVVEHRVVLSLEAAAALRVRVVDEADAGVAGAVVSVWGPLEGPSRRRSQTTDAAGFGGIKVRPGVYGLATPADSPVIVRVAVHEGLNTVTLRSAAALRVSGRVVLLGGEPLPRAQLKLDCAGRDAATVAADEGGGFEHWLARPGHCLVRLVDPRARAAPQTVPAPSADVRVVADTGASVRGRVVARDGRPVAGFQARALTTSVGALVQQFTVEAEMLGAAEPSDAQGVFELRGLRAGRYVVAGRMPGRAFISSQPFVLHAGGSVDLGTLVERPRAVVRGVVKDSTGRPLLGVWVTSAQSLSAPFATRLIADFVRGDVAKVVEEAEVTTVTDATGRFELVAVDGLSGLKFEAPGFQALERRWDDEAFVEVRLTALEPCRVHGRVVGERGPLTRFFIGRDEHAAADGTFDVACPDDGALTFGAPDHASRRVDVPGKGPRVALGDVALVADERVWVSVRTVDADGAPLESVAVGFFRLDGGAFSDGEYTDVTEVARLRVHPEVLEARLHGEAIEPLTLNVSAPWPGVKTFTVERAAAQVSGVLAHPDGLFAGAAVSWAGDHGTVAGPDGAFRLDQLPSGQGCLKVVARQVAVQYRRWVSLRPAEKAQVDLGGAGATVELQLDQPGMVLLVRDGTEPRDVRSWVSGCEADGEQFEVGPLPAGTLRLPGIRPGRWGVYAFTQRSLAAEVLLQGHRVTPTLLDLAPGDVRRVNAD